MSEPLLHDLALILVVAGLTTIIFKALKQPLVLGYIVAGFFTGPYFSYLPNVAQAENIKFWGDIGVIFLLFGLGLEFSFKKLKRVGGPGFITVLAETVIMFSVGYILARALGWSWMNAIFLGGMLTISSTSIIIKAFEDLGLRNRGFTNLVFGVLVVEDLVAILQLVILSALAVTSYFDGSLVLRKSFYLGLFLLFWFTGGVFIIPSLLRKLKRWVNDEILLIFSLGLCLGMVVITEQAGFSAALGAFIMGSILAECDQSEKIIKLTKPIKDFFGAIFFLSVGMLVDPNILVQYWKPVILISAAVVVIKSFSATFGLLLAGNNLKTSMQSGFCLCQIGEFSFIIATLGLSLKVIDDFLYPVIVSVSIITTFVTPYYIKFAVPAYNAVYKMAPGPWKILIKNLGSGKRTLDRESDWNALIKSYFTRIFIYGGWNVLVFLFFTRFANPYVTRVIGEFSIDRYIFATVTLIGMSPFIFALIRRRDDGGYFDRIWADSRYSRGPLLTMVVFKYLLAALFIALTISYYLKLGYGVVIIIVSVILTVVYLSRTLKDYYSHLESRFLNNLSSDNSQRSRFVIPRELADEIHIETIDIEIDSRIAGMTISELHRKNRTGVQVIQIGRGNGFIDLPLKGELLLPGDRLLVVGNDESILKFKELSQEPLHCDCERHEDMGLFHFTVSEHSPVAGSEANISEFRNNYDLLLIGIDKPGDNQFLRPHSSITIEPNDIVWVVGSKQKANEISKANSKRVL